MSTAKIDPKNLKVNELKAELAKRGLDTTGLKGDLVMRLQTALDDEEFNLDAEGSFAEPAAAAVEQKEAHPAVAVAVAAAESVAETTSTAAETVSETKAEEPVKVEEEVAAATATATATTAAAAAAAAAAAVTADPVIAAEQPSTSKLIERAHRFGTNSAEAAKTIEQEKKALRAARFGIPPKENEGVPEEKEKKEKGGRKRGRGGDKEKGAEAAAAPEDPELAAKIQKRVERFGVVSDQVKEAEAQKRKAAEEEKKKQRGERFNTAQTQDKGENKKQKKQQQQQPKKQQEEKPKAPVDPEMEAKLAQRLQRFAQQAK